MRGAEDVRRREAVRAIADPLEECAPELELLTHLRGADGPVSLQQPGCWAWEVELVCEDA